MLRSLLSVSPIVLAALAALPAPAAPAAAQGVPARPEPAALPVQPGELVFRYTSENRKHMLGRDYSSHDRIGFKVVLQLLAGGKLHAEETGSRVSGSSSSGIVETDRTSWKNTWDGTWAAPGDALQLSLTISGRECTLTRTKKPRGGREETAELLCTPVSLEARVTCRLLPDPVPIQSQAQAGQDSQPKPQPQRIWSCEPPEPAGSRISEVYRPWQFAQRGCLAVIARGGYQTCGSWP